MSSTGWPPEQFRTVSVSRVKGESVKALVNTLRGTLALPPHSTCSPVPAHPFRFASLLLQNVSLWRKTAGEI